MKDKSKKENLSSVIRAITANDNLEVNFDDDVKVNFFEFNQSYLQENNIKLPAINDYYLEESSNVDRSFIDLAAAYKLFHDFDLEDNYNIQEKSFIADFEKIRLVSLIKEEFVGCAINILKEIEQDVDFLLDYELSSKHLSLILLESLLDEKIGPRTKKKISEISKKTDNLDPNIAKLIRNLIKNVDNQQEFAKNSLEVQELLRKSLENEQKDKEEEQEDDNEEEKIEDNISNIAKNSLDFDEDESNITQNEQESLENEDKSQENQENQTENEVKSKETKNFSPNSNKSSEIGIEFKNPYKIYTSKYDEIVNPQKITTKEDLEFLRLELNEKLESLKDISNKLTTKLKKKLLSKKFRNPNPNDIEGILNRKKLASIIVSPNPRNIYLDNIRNDLNDTAITLLLDNSGSMRGRPIIMAALACEILASILEEFQIKTEIIGFTTADWKGGRARKDWEIAGKPKNPGRLNELRHIIYKSFDHSFKKSKVNMGLMLKEGILKENIDGEAVLFAKSRLLQREEERKILMVISDGNPIDDSTNLANEEDILSDHLKHVVNNIQKQKEIEILAIGVGHDTDNFYHNSITIRKLEELGDAMIENLSELL